MLVLAERPGAAEELCAGARAMGADEVALGGFRRHGDAALMR